MLPYRAGIRCPFVRLRKESACVEINNKCLIGMYTNAFLKLGVNTAELSAGDTGLDAATRSYNSTPFACDTI